MRLPERIALLINSKTHHIGRMPVLALMPHSRCNCRCLMCDIWRANKNLNELPADVIDNHLAAFRKLGVRWIVLSGGEALMHSDLWQVCEVLRPLRARITLLSTGLLLKRHAESIREYVDEVIVSMDGDQELHDQIRNIPRAFERLREGVQALRLAAPTVEIGARCVIQQANYHHFAKIVAAAEELGVDWISFLAADVSSDAFNRADSWSGEKIASVALSTEQCDELEQGLHDAFEQLRDQFESNFIVESLPKLLRMVAHFRAHAGVSDFPVQRCNAPWTSAVIEPNGEVRPCFFHGAFGNLRDGDFGSIVNSPRAVQFRRELDVTQNPTCQRCTCALNV
jgi:MoaA/NifB/PqqE/SkfB family radical SAM enzyme